MDRAGTLRQAALKRGVTLIEVLIAISLLSVIALALSSIDLFTRHHVIGSDRRAKLQNEVSYPLEHMNKHISQAIGDALHNPVSIEDNQHKITVAIDGNHDGILNDASTAIYSWSSSDNDIKFNATEIIAKRITDCVFTHTWNGIKENFVSVKITACWDPSQEARYACGTPDNPSVTMSESILMPSVSTN